MNTVGDALPSVLKVDLPTIQAHASGVLLAMADSYIETRYSQAAQRMLTVLLAECGVDGDKPNRAAHIKSALTWTKNVVAYAYQTIADVADAETLEDALALPWDLASFDASDPAVTIPGTIAITD